VRPGLTIRPGRARGAALAVAIALLVVLTLLAFAAIQHARAGRAGTAGDASARQAFEAAELGSALGLAAVASGRVPARPVAGAAPDGASYLYRLERGRAAEVATVPEGYSIGAGAGYAAVYYEVRATGHAARREVSIDRSVYAVGPADE
jgi:hypothetical protein